MENNNTPESSSATPPVTPQPGPDSSANEAGKALSALGAAKGGRARANTLTPGQRSEIARQAVQARWAKAGKTKPAPEPTSGDSGGIDSGGSGPPEQASEPGPGGQARPYSLFRGFVKIGNLDLECHVLSDSRRVFTQREVVRAISGGRESGNIQRYLQRNPLTASEPLGQPIVFDVPMGGKHQPKEAFGYEATLLVDIASKYMEAFEQGLLKKSQFKLAMQSGIILRSCAKIGIIALIDEATGFQKIRAKQALQIKLQAFIADEMQEWARMFPEEFWIELARLESIHYAPRSRPLRWGKYVMAFVYDAIDSDVGNALREKNPNPHHGKNHHQFLQKYGRDRVTIQIEKVITIMKLCHNMEEFRRKFAHVFKKTPMQLTFADMDWNLGSEN